jgi:predicted permease
MINLKFAFRLLWKTPFVTIVAIASLALGIGANAAIFSIFNQMLLRPLPVQDPGALVNLKAPGPNPGRQSCGLAGDCDEVFSYPMFRDLQREQKAFTGIAAHIEFGVNLAARNKTLSGNGMMVSGSYFPVLGLQPALGRLLGPDDDRLPGESRVVVLSYDYWQTTFGNDPAVVNQVLIVNGQSLTIVGVAPHGFSSTTLGSKPQVFVPITLRGAMRPGFNGFDNRRSYWAYLFARLKPGVSMAQASAAINIPYHALLNNVEAPLQEGMSDNTMAKFKAKQLQLVPGARGQSSVDKIARTPLTMLFAVTAFVLLIACANIANLLLARSAARAGEMAVRLSIGGSRAQLVAQLMTESLILGLIGGLLGLGVARATLGVMSAMLPDMARATFTPHLDPVAVAFTAALTMITALVFGLFPALYATRPDLTSALRANTGQPSGGRSASRWRTSLATAQIALSMALLGAAGLFTKSLANVSRVDLGVKVDHVVTFAISPALNGYKSPESMQLIDRLSDELQQVPGVTGVTTSVVGLLAGDNWGSDVDVEGYTQVPDADNGSRYNEVGPGYFSTLSVPLMAGREFTRADGLTAPRVAIVNQAFAKRFNLGANPVGKRIDKGNKKFDILIVGLVRNAKYNQVKDSVPALFFIPLAQDDGVGGTNFYVRTTLDPKLLIPAIPRVVAKLDANLPVETLRTMPEQIRVNVFMDRFISLSAAAFAGLATLLAAIGLYGVLAYTVAQRTREIGVRMALGAAPGRVLLMILRQVGGMTVVGGVIGVVAAIGAGRAAQSLLYQMQGYDPMVLGVAAVTLSAVAVGAGLVPAYRASRVEPTQALRYE